MKNNSSKEVDSSKPPEKANEDSSAKNNSSKEVDSNKSPEKGNQDGSEGGIDSSSSSGSCHFSDDCVETEGKISGENNLTGIPFKF